MRRVFGFILGALLFSSFALVCFSQDTKRNDRPVEETAPPILPGDKQPVDATRYTYEFTQPRFLISHILIEHDALGRGKITFQNKNGDSPIVEPIALSAAAIGRIFELWTKLHFLE